MSQGTLERCFRAAVGASPKMLSRLVRLQHVCRLWDARKSLTEIAFEAGYCDQPHFVRDFRLFTGTPPEGIVTLRHRRSGRLREARGVGRLLTSTSAAVAQAAVTARQIWNRLSRSSR